MQMLAFYAARWGRWQPWGTGGGPGGVSTRCVPRGGDVGLRPEGSAPVFKKGGHWRLGC